jgi:hypothetical protein
LIALLRTDIPVYALKAERHVGRSLQARRSRSPPCTTTFCSPEVEGQLIEPHTPLDSSDGSPSKLAGTAAAFAREQRAVADVAAACLLVGCSPPSRRLRQAEDGDFRKAE